MILAGSYDSSLVFVSVAVASFASFTALSLAGRGRASRGWPRLAWLATASVALGGGIWSMHFIGMLAFSMPGMAVSYDPGLTLLSLALAIGFTAGGLAVMGGLSRSIWRILCAGALMGVGVIGMHYLGMTAMQMPASLSYDPAWFGVSVLIAIGAATGAVYLASRDHGLVHRIIAAAVMGLAISGMHYAGMKAAMFTHTGTADLDPNIAGVSPTLLAGAVGTLTCFVLILALGAARLERAAQTYARREARTLLRLNVADLLRERDIAALNDVAALIGGHFGASRTGYAQLDAEEDFFDYDVCWTDGSVPPLLGRFPAAAFGAKIVAALSAGQTVVVEDLLDAELSDEARTRETARNVDTRSILVVPFVRDGRLRTIVYLNDRHPRRWEPDDISFMEDIAERTRLVIERATAERHLQQLNATLEARIEERTAALHKAEQAQRAADTLYRAYFESTPDPLFVLGVDPDGGYIVEQVNPAHEAGVGFKLEEIRGKRIEDILPPPAAARVIAAYRHAVETREIYQFREVFELSAGPQHWDTTLVPLSNDSGRIVRLIGASRDVTRQVLAEEALRQSQKMEAMGKLTGGVAHDFNNLLTPIVGVLDRLSRKGLGDERDQLLIGGAVQAADRARTLVQRLLSFARRQPLQTTAVDVANLVRELAGLIESTTGPTVQVIVDVADPLPPAVADANQLEMALLNLAVNARDAMPEGGSLRISVSAAARHEPGPDNLEPGSYILIAVTDTGSGMDEETRRHAVEPFFSTKGIGQGTGLGLSMVHGLAAQLGGALTIQSELGAGTTIRLWLRESTNPVSSTEQASQVEFSTPGRATALLVDDEDLVRASTANMLEELGYEVKEATSAEDALRQLDAGLAPDLVVTDHLMPGITGTELAHRILGRSAHAQVLIISGYAEAEGIDPTLPRLTKPFRQSDLVEKLAEISAR